MIDLIEISIGSECAPIVGALNPPSPCDLTVKIDARTILPADLADSANFLQHRIITNSAFYHHDERVRGVVHRFTNLKADYLRQIIPKRIWTKLIKEATAIGLIERSQYIPTIKCYGYRIGDRFAGNPTIIVPVKGNRIRKKILAHRKSQSHHKLQDKTYRHLLGWLGKIAIPESKWAEIQERGYARYLAGGGRLCKTEYMNYVRTQLLGIKLGKHRFGVDDFGRVHSTISNLIKPAREHLTSDGQPLVELDIVNSQPVFFTELLLEQFKNTRSLPSSNRQKLSSVSIDKSTFYEEMSVISSTGKERDGKIEKNLISEIHNQQSINLIPTREMVPLECTRKGVHPEYPSDVITWKALIENGTLYSHLMGLIGWTEGRDEFKKNEMFAVLYGNPNRNQGRMDDNWNWLPPSTLKPILAEHFPTIWAFLIFYHNQHGHGSLARELQRRESNLMIRGVCGTLAERHPEVPVLTCHDAILTTPEHIQLVQELILSEFSERGLHPTLKITGMPSNRP